MKWFPLLVVLALLSAGILGFGAAPWQAPTVAEVDAALEGLGFDEFIETSYRLYVLRSPQRVTSMGLAAEFGVRNDALDDYSPEYQAETFAIESLILERLRGFDCEMLTEAQHMTCDIALWYWDDLVRDQAFAGFHYPVHFMTVWSLPGFFQFTMTEDHPFASVEDVEDYITRLERAGEQFDQIIARMERGTQNGIIAPRSALEWAIRDIRAMATYRAILHPLYKSLEEKATDIPGIAAEEFDAYLTQAAQAIEDVVKPAYERLLEAIYGLIPRSSREISISRFEGGGEAYAHLLRHHTQTELTPTEIHQAGLQQIARIQTEVHQAAVALGFEDTTSMTGIFEQAAIAGGAVSGEDAVDEAERLIAKAQRIVIETSALSRLPRAGVIAIGIEAGGYYSPPAIDGSRPGAYYVTTGGTESLYQMPTIAYHETVPGHHIQIAFAQEVDLPLLRQDVIFTGFSEGWALYGERLMSELGGYEDDPFGNLGRLQYELVRAVRMVADTGIHDLGWSFDDAVTYIMRNTGDPRGTAEYRALRYALFPGQATAYMIGLLEILELREAAQEALGESFDLATFHEIILGQGNIPLPFLRDLVEEWIDQ